MLDEKTAYPHISEKDMRNSVDKFKTFEKTLGLVEQFIRDGKLVYEGEEKTAKDMLIPLGHLETYLNEEFEEGESKSEMEKKLKDLRQAIEAKIN
jgi:hypothetical protein